MRNPNITHHANRIELEVTAFDELKNKLKEAGFKVDVGEIAFNLTSKMVRFNPVVHKEIIITHKAPVPEMEKLYPCVLYFDSAKEANDFMAMVKAAKPNMTEKDL